MHDVQAVYCCCRYVKFDTFHPAVDRGLPVTRVISRVVLQQLLAETAISMAGEDVILNDQNVVDYQHEVSHHQFADVHSRISPAC